MCISKRRARIEAVCGSRTTAYQWIGDVLPWALFLGLVIYLAVEWQSLPDKIPVNYDLQGNITRWGGKGNLLVYPIIMLASNLIMWVVGWFPQNWNTGIKITVLNRVRAFRLVRDLLAGIQILIAVMFFLNTLTMIHYQWAFSRWYMKGGIWIPIVLLVAPMIRFFIQIRRL